MRRQLINVHQNKFCRSYSYGTASSRAGSSSVSVQIAVRCLTYKKREQLETTELNGFQVNLEWNSYNMMEFLSALSGGLEKLSPGHTGFL